MNVYDLNGKDFLQKNVPGNDGYGQSGTNGIKGQAGNSVYFTPFDLSIEENMAICISRISEGKELSDNGNYESLEINYRNNDYVIDSFAYVYLLVIDEDSVSLRKLRNLYESGNPIADVICVSYVTNEEGEYDLTYLQNNPNYMGVYDVNSSSPYIYHRDRYSDKVPGVWLEFTVQHVADALTYDYTYKYVLILPNGHRVEKYSNLDTCDLFVESRMLYGCELGLRENAIGYDTVENSSEYDIETAEMFQSVIREMCTAYVDVMAVNGQIYRKYISVIQ